MELKMTQLADGLCLIKLSGRLDLESVNQIEAEFMASVAGEKSRVLVDLSEVSFIASTGFRLLLNAAKAVAAHGGKLGFLNPTAGLREVLDVIGVLAIIPVYADIEAAQKAM